MTKSLYGHVTPSPLTMNHFLKRTIHLTRQWRGYASISAQDLAPFQVFDRHAKQGQRDLAAAKNNGATSATVDYLRDEVADRMLERLEDIKRKFDTILDLVLDIFQSCLKRARHGNV
jgi:ATP-dependent protease HslVU (ClpYQ) peptidase subunit